VVVRVKHRTRVRLGDRCGTVIAANGPTVRVAWDDGGEGYAVVERLTVLKTRLADREDALAFVRRARAECATTGGHMVATPIDVLIALAGE
jgi:hypothetical protein